MKHSRSGFTLVELLVVITIIGILMGLLIPAVQAARETARRNQCSVQIKNLALAAIQRANNKGSLPGYVEKYGVFAGGGAIDPSDPASTAPASHVKLGTWAVALLPYLDAQPTYEQWTEDRYPIIHGGGANAEYSPTTGDFEGIGFHPLAAPNLAIMQCPSNGFGVGEQGKNSYVSNNGMSHLVVTQAADPGQLTVRDTLATSPTGAGADFEASQSRANGLFNCKYNIAGATGTFNSVFEGPAVRLDDIKDGSGNTVMFSENIQALPWHRAGLIDAANLQIATATDEDIAFNFGTANFDAARYVHGMVWHYADPQALTAPSGFPWNNLDTTMPQAPTEVISQFRINGGGTSVSDEIFNKTIDDHWDAVVHARPSSAHIDGANASMADGGTRYLTETIDYRVYQALLTPRGKSSDVPWPEYVLDPEAL
ncbi:MAG: DUF1559 domain-containing protein [Planctomycetota bacterium]